MLKVLDGPVLAHRTTLRLGGRALAEVRAAGPRDLDELPGALARLGGEPRMLGCGSNILADDGELPVVVVALDSGGPFDTAPEVTGETEDGRVLVRVGAAQRLPRLVSRLSAWGLCGMEGLAGIPGAVGGAVAMNAGSYGCECGAALHAVSVFSPALGHVTLGRDRFRYGYRHFEVLDEAGAPLGGWYLVTAAIFALSRCDSAVVHAAMRGNYLKKKATQPVLSHSAGCVFRNPSPLNPAGKLLDAAGLKGYRIGDMAFSTMHANFMVNEGHGVAKDAFSLLQYAKVAVSERFGVDLELEVKVWSWR
ncbi:UDP-N-acetylmuramate dehydrogenase [Nitratidesulfovibrio sp. SRB-5]|uniref:UDP-N-acetylmuramate dehydrogenase n=1 Tax=Nitratidesulfovibrio sp. SRB-5 TaxID=2872636 RepID=UPI001025660F|nr:UDP-N-acetylmuramate dehydrogenase [Nitratidesulfovibrio sp. SRB-5]MBZ2173564.1 UDP-N-acetylmuramate dehydrogenase [Nitratidesulfovibrio sp. SRB-5]RXF78294.1 UDP-N-acetylmuramate dehydrogenase [Desulfovibrio sp. DS-1]